MSLVIPRRGSIAAQQKVPSAPLNVEATAGDSEASLTWQAAYAGTAPVTDYEVTVSPTTGVSGATTRSVGSPTTGFTFTGLTNGTSYTFTVVAINAVGNSWVSQPSNAVVPHTMGVPNVPSLSVSVSEGTATHTFNEVADATNYRIETELVSG